MSVERAAGLFSPTGRSAEQSEAMRGKPHTLRVMAGVGPLIRPFGPPSPRRGEDMRRTLSGLPRMLAGFLLLFAVLVSAFPASAFNPDEVLKDPALEQRARNLTSQLRCMVCQNQSIDDSNAELARDLRVLVRERLVEGDSDKAVIDYVVSRYGEFVLLKPRLSLRTVLLWGAPIGLTLVGIFAVFVFSRRRATLEQPQKLSADEEERIRNLIEK